MKREFSLNIPYVATANDFVVLGGGGGAKGAMLGNAVTESSTVTVTGIRS